MVAVIGLKLWIGTNARDGLDQLHRFAAAKARDRMARFVFGFCSDCHAAKVRLKSTCHQYGCLRHHQNRPLVISKSATRGRNSPAPRGNYPLSIPKYLNGPIREQRWSLLLWCQKFKRITWRGHFIVRGAIMPGDPRECRDHALRCLQLAKTASSPQAKAKFIDLASTWNKLAADIEATQAILESDKVPD